MKYRGLFLFAPITAIVAGILIVAMACGKTTQSPNSNPLIIDTVFSEDQIQTILNSWETVWPPTQDTSNGYSFVVTYSPECPISLSHVGEIKRVTSWIDSVRKIAKGSRPMPRFWVLVSDSLPGQYKWIAGFSIKDAGFSIAKKMGFVVYPQLRIYKVGQLVYSGKLSNRATRIGEKAPILHSSDSSYLWMQWLNCQQNRFISLNSNEAVGCYIE